MICEATKMGNGGNCIPIDTTGNKNSGTYGASAIRLMPNKAEKRPRRRRNDSHNLCLCLSSSLSQLSLFMASFETETEIM